MGRLAQPLVLDPRSPMVGSVGLVGIRARVRELVPAWIRQPSRVRVDHWHGQSLGGLGAAPTLALRCARACGAAVRRGLAVAIRQRAAGVSGDGSGANRTRGSTPVLLAAKPSRR